MCTPKQQFLFCTCKDKNKPSTTGDLLPYYSWTLRRALTEKKRLIMGKIILPKEDLGEGITLATILAQLNTQSHNFDFSYEPQERDSLRISFDNKKGASNYFRIAYQQGQWIEGSAPSFGSSSEELATGHLLKIPPSNK